MSPKHKKVLSQIRIGTLKHDTQAKSLATIKLIRVLKSGQRVRIKSPESKKGPKSDFMQVIDEIFVNGKSVRSASPSTKTTIQITVDQQAYENDVIYLVKLDGGGGGNGGGGNGGGGNGDGGNGDGDNGDGGSGDDGNGGDGDGGDDDGGDGDGGNGDDGNGDDGNGDGDNGDGDNGDGDNGDGDNGDGDNGNGGSGGGSGNGGKKKTKGGGSRG